MYHHFVGFGAGVVDPATGVPVNLYEWSDKAVSGQLKPVHQDMLEHYNANSLFELYSSKVKVYQENNVIKLSSKTRPGIKMESETAREKALCRLFFCASKEKSVQQTKRMEYPLKKCSYEPNYATL